MDRARDEALRMQSLTIDLEHVLLGLLSVSAGIAYFALKRHRLYWKEVHAQLLQQAREKQDREKEIIFPSDKVHEMSLRAFEVCKEYEEALVDTEHILLALLEIKHWRTRDVFDSFGVDLNLLRDDVKRYVMQKRKVQDSHLAMRFYEMPKPRGVITSAEEESRRLGHNFVGTEQILVGILKQEGTLARILSRFGVNYENASKEVEKIIGLGSSVPTKEIPFTPRAKRAMELSWDEARHLKHDFVSAEHMLLGIIRQGEGVASHVLIKLGVDLADLRNAVVDSFSEEDDDESSSSVLRK
jgi:ATP-dependent Clp protease ATP-binding subunit ClpA